MLDADTIRLQNRRAIVIYKPVSGAALREINARTLAFQPVRLSVR